MKSLEHGDVKSLLRHIACKAQAGRTRTYYGWLVHLEMYALALALLLLRTNSTANGWQGRGVLQNLGGGKELATLGVLDEGWNVDAHWAALHAGRLRTVETAFRLGECHLLGQADVYFLGAGGSTIYRVQFRHLHTLDGGALLGFHRRA